MFIPHIRYYNYLHEKVLGFDSDGNGVSEGWTLFGVSDVTYENTVSGDFQVINITDTTNPTGSILIRTTETISAVVGDVFNYYVDGYVSGNVEGRIWIVYFDSGGGVLQTDATSFTNTSLSKIKLVNSTAPTNTSYIRPYIVAITENIGDSGFSYFKNAVLVKNNTI